MASLEYQWVTFMNQVVDEASPDSPALVMGITPGGPATHSEKENTSAAL